MEPRHSLTGYLLGSLKILQRSLELYDQGEREFYRVMAVELRLLLCDTTRRHDAIFDLSLVPRVLPDFALPPLSPTGAFDPAANPLPLTRWLEQEISLGALPPLTLRQLIRQVCDQDGGAHVDQRPRSGLPSDAGQAGWMRAVAVVVVDALEERVKKDLPGG